MNCPDSFDQDTNVFSRCRHLCQEGMSKRFMLFYSYFYFFFLFFFSTILKTKCSLMCLGAGGESFLQVEDMKTKIFFFLSNNTRTT